MAGRLLYGVLAMCSTAMFLFVTGFVTLHLGLLLLTGLLYIVAGKLLLIAFGSLLLLGGASLFISMFREVRAYYKREAVALRKIWAAETARIHLLSRSTLERRQLYTLFGLKRERLSMADDKKQLRALYASVLHELLEAEQRMPVDGYRKLRQTLRQSRKRADAEAMLALRQRIPGR